MHSSDFFLFLACLASTIFALIVSENLDVVGNANHFGDLYIDPGVYLAFDNRNGYIRNTFDGVVTVNGQLFVIDTGNNEGMSVTFGSGFTNNGDVVLNAASETSACDFRFTGPAFVNSGHIYMGGIGNTGGSTMNIWPSLVTVPQNYGTVTYAQSVSRSGGNAFFGQTGQSVLNEGTICLYQMNFYQRSKVQGTGCYSVGQDSLLIIDQASTNPLPSSQTIYLSTSSSQVSFGLSMPSNTFTIVGWGNGNKIGFLTLVLSATISGSVLTVDVGFFTFTFNVGEGYEQQYISVSSGGFSGGIFILAYVSYSQPPPSASRPSVCNDCPTIFDFPEPQRSSSSSSDISSSSEVSSSSSSSEISSSSSSSEISSSSSSSEISSSSSSSEISSSSSSSEISSSRSSSEISSSSSSSEVSSSSFESSSSYSSSSVESSSSSVSSTSSSFNSESSFSSSSIVVSSSSSSHEQSSSQVTFSVESSSSTTQPDVVSNSCPICSRYTTTFTLTEIGTERIVSGVVVITTTEGLLTTVTSLFPEESPLTSSSSQTPSPVSDISASTTRSSSDSGGTDVL
ncbi:putative cell wall protein [Clavispora lusitaniae]|uniref:Cell wall protein n=1 Tax=Clavispora lusitaniae TaxID=36911 RepID=A0ACD0WIJ5_CLALS|nr:putative cell wall protein [Clavispora lusitaniae]QFZ32714.1 putative cell wall protein [Clavispora lusitaniae]QFZ38383.1 putative cell wall protein [Clavispora lusitaniae]QFZ44066.1 putative cell wall protein [Clavispora lusitaniae]QFZ49743.1 putative cell wall protein [Clavispora lusitaniae]